LDKFVGKALVVGFPAGMARVLCSARLRPLPKVGAGGKGTRPVASGEVLQS